jgi:hypothetical protein
LKVDAETEKATFKDIHEVISWYKSHTLPKSQLKLEEECESIDERLLIGKLVGEGSFGKRILEISQTFLGKVYLATWNRKGNSLVVAAKNPNEQLKLDDNNNEYPSTSDVPFNKEIEAEANISK